MFKLLCKMDNVSFLTVSLQFSPEVIRWGRAIGALVGKALWEGESREVHSSVGLRGGEEDPRFTMGCVCGRGAGVGCSGDWHVVLAREETAWAVRWRYGCELVIFNRERRVESNIDVHFVYVCDAHTFPGSVRWESLGTVIPTYRHLGLGIGFSVLSPLKSAPWRNGWFEGWVRERWTWNISYCSVK